MAKVLITGWNKWIGKACTEKFVEAWHSVVVLARDTSMAPEHASVTCHDVDLLDYAQIDLEQLDVLDCDVLINNAWLMYGVGYQAYTPEMQQSTMQLNVEVPVWLITQLAPYMKKSGGRVVSVWSIAGHVGHPDIWYGISKAAVHNFTKSFAKVLWPDGVQCTCIAPWPVNTAMLSSIPEVRKEQLKASTTSGRFVEPEEVADVIYYLAVDAPDYVNGICVDIKDGMHFR